jgi:hypothetical protein
MKQAGRESSPRKITSSAGNGDGIRRFTLQQLHSRAILLDPPGSTNQFLRAQSISQCSWGSRPSQLTSRWSTVYMMHSSSRLCAHAMMFTSPFDAHASQRCSAQPRFRIPPLLIYIYSTRITIIGNPSKTRQEG